MRVWPVIVPLFILAAVGAILMAGCRGTSQTPLPAKEPALPPIDRAN